MSDAGVKRAPGDASLFEAIRSGDLKAARAMLESGADPNALEWGRGSYRSASWLCASALGVALFKGHAEIALALIEAGARVDGSVEAGGIQSGELPHLAMAIMSPRRVECVELLASRGASAEGPAAMAMGFAASWGRADGVRALLKAGVSSRGVSGEPLPLYKAARAGSAECVDLLMGAARTAEEGASDASVSLLAMAERMDARGVSLLMGHCDPDARDSWGMTALMLAASVGAFECVKALAPVSDVLALGPEGASISSMARQSGCERSFGLLREREAVAREAKALDEAVGAGQGPRRGVRV